MLPIEFSPAHVRKHLKMKKLREVLLYISIGIVTFIIDILFFAMGYFITGNSLISSVISVSVATFIGYIANYKYNFNQSSTSLVLSGYFKYMLICQFGTLLLITLNLIDHALDDQFLLKILASVLALPIQLHLSKKYVFNV